jgi:hypothetical protein
LVLVAGGKLQGGFFLGDLGCEVTVELEGAGGDALGGAFGVEDDALGVALEVVGFGVGCGDALVLD